MEKNQLDTGSGYELPYDDALALHQLDHAGRRGVEHPQGMSIERRRRYWDVRWKVMQDGQQCPAVDRAEAD
ncbi:hypothetical protein ACIGMX_16870 [Streptomyces aquilus]|uniref:hypothetical protein n=1 Tax=Streptomyces aquilus TaxID=2548456 RepID=UPI0037D38B51